MIKVNATLTGTVSRNAEQHYDHENKPRYSFRLRVGVPSNIVDGAAIDVFVEIPPQKVSNELMSALVAGSRATVLGVLNVYAKKNGEVPQPGKSAEPQYFCTAETITSSNIVPEGTEISVSSVDSVGGDLEFSGSVSKNIETKKNKRGYDFLVFSASSTEKDRTSGQFYSLYVRFVRFSEQGMAPDTLRPAWLQPKAKVIIHGDFKASSYNGRLSFSSRVRDISEKPPYVPQH